MKLSIRTKLTAAFLVILGLLALVGFLSLTQIRRLDEEAVDLAQRRYPLILETMTLAGEIEIQGRDNVSFMLLGSEAYLKEFEEAGAKIRDSLTKIEGMARTDRGKALIVDIKAALKEFESASRPLHQASAMVASPERDQAIVNLREARTKVSGLIDEFIEYQQELISDVLVKNARAADQSQLTILVSGAVTLLLSMILAYVISTGLARAARSVAEEAARMARGDLSGRDLIVRSGDEMAQMMVAFNQMKSNMREMIVKVVSTAQAIASGSEQLRSTSDQVARASQEVARAVGQVANGAQEQTRGVSSTVQVVNELKQAISEIASGAQQQAASAQKTSVVVVQVAKAIEDASVKAQSVAAGAQQTSEAARRGSLVVGATVEGMEVIKKTVLETADRIRELGERSQQIGQIVEVISDIADQTNLLALNAAIEAARAGEHGKGFAVVAEEVRKLAERSGRSTREIADLVNGIKQGTDEAVSSMSAGTAEVEKGARLAYDAGRTLEEILQTVTGAVVEIQAISGAIQRVAASTDEVVQAVESVAAVSEENTAATEELAAGSDQIHSSLESIARISADNAAAAEEVSASVEEMTASTEEIAASAQSLTQVAEELRQLTGRFAL